MLTVYRVIWFLAIQEPVYVYPGHMTMLNPVVREELTQQIREYREVSIFSDSVEQPVYEREDYHYCAPFFIPNRISCQELYDYE